MLDRFARIETLLRMFIRARVLVLSALVQAVVARTRPALPIHVQAAVESG